MMGRTFKIMFVVTLLVFCSTFLFGCSQADYKAVFDIENATLSVFPGSGVIDKEAELSSGLVSIKENNETTYVEISCLDVDKVMGNIDGIIQDVEKAIPSLSGLIPSVSVDIQTEYYGSELFGTYYYEVSISSDRDFTFPLEIVSNDLLFCNGDNSVKNEGGHHLNTVVSVNDGKGAYRLQRIVDDFEACLVSIDVTGVSPSVTYTIFRNDDGGSENSIRQSLASVGLYLESYSKSKIICSEKFETSNDFQFVFPTRFFNFFGTTTTVNADCSSSFVEKRKVSIRFDHKSDSEIVVEIVPPRGSDLNGSYMISSPEIDEGIFGPKKEGVMRVLLYENCSLGVNYSKFRTETVAIAAGVFVGLVFVIFCMIAVAKRRS